MQQLKNSMKQGKVMKFLYEYWIPIVIILVLVMFWRKIKQAFSGFFDATGSAGEGAATIAASVAGGIKTIAQTLGLVDDPNKAAFDNFKNLSQNPLDASTFAIWQKSQPKTALITSASAQAIAKTIHDSMGWFLLDDVKMLGAFKQLKNQYQIAWVAQKFYEVYKKDLLSYLEHSDQWWHGGFKPATLKELSDYILKLPKF